MSDGKLSTLIYKHRFWVNYLRCLGPLTNLPFHKEQQTSISHSLKYIIRRIKVKFWQCLFSSSNFFFAKSSKILDTKHSTRRMCNYSLKAAIKCFLWKEKKTLYIIPHYELIVKSGPEARRYEHDFGSF